MLRSEVLPAPFGPMTETSPPRRTDSETVSTARTPPKCFETSEMTSCSAPETTAGAVRLPDTLPPAFPHPSDFGRLMPYPYGRHDAEACGRMQSPMCPPHAF